MAFLSVRSRFAYAEKTSFFNVWSTSIFLVNAKVKLRNAVLNN